MYWLAENINIEGIIEKERDTEFDDLEYYRSGGIRLKYENKKDQVEGLKAGILLEAGFDTVAPNKKITISSWAYDKGIESIDVIDNRALDIRCYHPGYTFVEKLQTIAKRFRLDQNDSKELQPEKQWSVCRDRMGKHFALCQAERYHYGQYGNQAGESYPCESQLAVQRNPTCGDQAYLRDKQRVPQRHHRAVDLQKQGKGRGSE